MKLNTYNMVITFSCNENGQPKVTDENLEKYCNMIGEGIARCFSFDRHDAACVEKISLIKKCDEHQQLEEGNNGHS
jgi:hypothetical protein